MIGRSLFHSDQMVDNIGYFILQINLMPQTVVGQHSTTTFPIPGKFRFLSLILYWLKDRQYWSSQSSSGNGDGVFRDDDGISPVISGLS